MTIGFFPEEDCAVTGVRSSLAGSLQASNLVLGRESAIHTTKRLRRITAGACKVIKPIMLPLIKKHFLKGRPDPSRNRVGTPWARAGQSSVGSQRHRQDKNAQGISLKSPIRDLDH